MKSILSALTLAGFLAFCPMLGAQDVDPANFVSNLVTELVDAGRQPGDTSSSTAQVLESSLDFERIAGGVLGDYRATLSREDTKRFQTALQSSFVSLIGKALASFEEYELSIESVRRANGRAQVLAIMKPDSGGRYEAVFTLAASESAWRAQNLTLNGVNLGLTYRNQFAALMEENANDFDKTLEAWSSEINKLMDEEE